MSRKAMKKCDGCGAEMEVYVNPVPTVDIIIELGEGKIILIKRKSEPKGWAIPGGFVDYGESLETAAVREALEETSMNVTLVKQLHTYSTPDRDPRQHTISTVYIARGSGVPRAADDASDVGIFTEDTIPQPLMFDHEQILRDYFKRRRTTDTVIAAAGRDSCPEK